MIVFLTRGLMARQLIDCLNDFGRWMAFMASGQSTLETLALDASAGLTCLICLRSL